MHPSPPGSPVGHVHSMQALLFLCLGIQSLVAATTNRWEGDDSAETIQTQLRMVHCEFNERLFIWFLSPPPPRSPSSGFYSSDVLHKGHSLDEWLKGVYGGDVQPIRTDH